MTNEKSHDETRKQAEKRHVGIARGLLRYVDHGLPHKIAEVIRKRKIQRNIELLMEEKEEKEEKAEKSEEEKEELGRLRKIFHDQYSLITSHYLEYGRGGLTEEEFRAKLDGQVDQKVIERIFGY